MAGHPSRLDLEVVEQTEGVADEVGDRIRSRWGRRRGDAAVIEGHHAITGGHEGRNDLKVPGDRRLSASTDEDDWFGTGISLDLVGDLHTAKIDVVDGHHRHLRVEVLASLAETFSARGHEGSLSRSRSGIADR